MPGLMYNGTCTHGASKGKALFSPQELAPQETRCPMGSLPHALLAKHRGLGQTPWCCLHLMGRGWGHAKSGDRSLPASHGLGVPLSQDQELGQWAWP